MTAFDSARELSMKPQVFTMTKSAPSASDTSEYPSSDSVPSIFSLSTRFFGQPRLTKAYVPLDKVSAEVNGSKMVDGTRMVSEERRSLAKRGRIVVVRRVATKQTALRRHQHDALASGCSRKTLACASC